MRKPDYKKAIFSRALKEPWINLWIIPAKATQNNWMQKNNYSQVFGNQNLIHSNACIPVILFKIGEQIIFWTIFYSFN